MESFLLSSLVPYTVILCLCVCPLGSVVSTGHSQCPCSDQRLCNPIQTTAKNEILAFSRNRPHWKDYFWDNITTVAVEPGFDPQMMCHAHSKGVRIVVWGSFSSAVLFNETARESWVDYTVKAAMGNFTDGYSIDFEEPLQASQAGVLTDMVKLIKDSFTKALPYSHVSFDTPWKPGCSAFGRCFDYRSISEIVDYLMIMAYDELELNGTRAMANDPLNKTRTGVDAFLEAGIPASKLVLGLPWYGYDFPCENHSRNMNGGCTYQKYHWKQKEYGDLMTLLAHNSTSGRKWSEADESPYFEYKDDVTGQTHQIWYDDPISLKLRYSSAREKKLRGVAAFHADCLDYSTKQRAVNETNAMWDAFIGY